MARNETWQKWLGVARLEKEPEIRSLSSGITVANLSVSTENSYKDKQGEWQTKKDYHKIAVFGKSADRFNALPAGTLLFIEGNVETRKYESNGETKYVTEIKAERVEILGASDSPSSVPRTATGNVSGKVAAASFGRASAAPPTRSAPPPASRSSQDLFGDDSGITDSDIPF